MQTLCKSLPICSRCMQHEINSWLNENLQKISSAIIQKIHEELASIRLSSGQCIVCNSNIIVSNLSENILKIMEKYKTEEAIKKEFKKYFCFYIPNKITAPII